MAIPWGTIKFLLIFFGPWLLPRAVAQYHRLKTEAGRREQLQHQHGTTDVRPLSVRSGVLLALLAGAALAWLLSAGLVPSALTGFLRLPPSLRAPENIFVATQSRLQAPTDVLFTRLAARRPGHALTASDEVLRARLASLESRLLYLQYGPDVLTGCHFCGGTGVDAATSFSASAYFCYALVDLLAPHIANLVLIAVVTSPLLLLGRRGRSSSSVAASAHTVPGMDGGGGGGGGGPSTDYAYDVSASYIRRWRTSASIIALALAALDVYFVATYERQANARATRLTDLDPFFWTMRTYRGLACSALLGALATILYWAATGRHSSPSLGLLGVLLFGLPPPPSPAYRVTAVTRGLAGVKSKLSAGAIVKNTALRDTDLRARTQAYWAHEVMLVAEAMEEREVIEGVNDALLNRIDIQKIALDAEIYAQNVVPALAVPAAGGGQAVPVQQQQPQPQGVRSRSSTPVAAGAATKRL